MTEPVMLVVNHGEWTSEIATLLLFHNLAIAEVEPADIIELHPITDMGVMTHTAGEGENCRMEAHLPPGRYAVVRLDDEEE